MGRILQDLKLDSEVLTLRLMVSQLFARKAIRC